MGPVRTAQLGLTLAWTAMLASQAGAIAGEESRAAAEPPPPSRTRTLEITEYRIEGVTGLSQLEVEAAVEPYLGPQRTLEDIEKARAALEKAYSDKGYQTVSVSIPRQTVKGGVVTLKVTETTVGRLRVRGSHWFSLNEIKRQAPSVAEGSLPNFNDIVRDIFVLNQFPDRRVTPALRTGILPGTLDVDLNVQDRLPLHGFVELNNRFSTNTTPTRLNSSIRYDNLWQKGHSLSLSLQIAPERLRDATVFSAAYLVRVPDIPWLSFSFNGVLQNSDISTLGSLAVQGRGRIFGAHASFTLPSTASFFHTIGTGVDYKHFGKELLSDANAAPITTSSPTARLTLREGACVLELVLVRGPPARAGHSDALHWIDDAGKLLERSARGAFADSVDWIEGGYAVDQIRGDQTISYEMRRSGNQLKSHSRVTTAGSPIIGVGDAVCEKTH